MILLLFNNKDIFVVFYALIKNKSFFRWFKKKKTLPIFRENKFIWILASFKVLTQEINK